MAGLPEKSAFAHKKKTSKKIYGIIIEKEDKKWIQIPQFQIAIKEIMF